MKIDAEVELSNSKEKDIGESFVKVPVDIDYVEGNADSVKEWVRNALEEKYGSVFSDGDFTIANLDDIAEDIAFDEFEQKRSKASAAKKAEQKREKIIEEVLGKVKDACQYAMDNLIVRDSELEEIEWLLRQNLK